MKLLGLRVEFIKQKWPDLLKAARLSQLQMGSRQHQHDTDGFGFFGLLYGRNAASPGCPDSSSPNSTASRRRHARRRSGWPSSAGSRSFSSAYAPGADGVPLQNVLVQP
jgi:hypothetical protein